MGKIFDKMIEGLPDGIDPNYIASMREAMGPDELDAMCILGDEVLDDMDDL